MDFPAKKLIVPLAVLVGCIILLAQVVSRFGERLENGDDQRTDGHQQMLSQLASIANNAQNPFFGDAALNQLKTQLLRTPPRSVPELMVRFQLGEHELRRGATEAAIEQLTKCYQLLPLVEGAINPESRVEARTTTTFLLAVAYLRLGENENCVNCHRSESCIFPLKDGGIHEKREGSQKAIPYLEEVLALNPGDAAARWLLNLAHMTLGTYPEQVPDNYLIESTVFDSDEKFPRFTDVATEAGLNTRSLCGGAIIDDFNGDGLLDVVTSDWDVKGQLKFFEGTRHGKFGEQTEAAGLTGLYGGLNINQTDYNNDGHLDIYVMRGAWLADQGQHPNSLIRNNGDGTFTDVTLEAGLAKKNYPTQASAWADFNQDGHLDLYVGNEIVGNNPAPSQLFKNNGDGTFTDVAAEAGVLNNRYTKAVVWGDYDDDLDPDLYVSCYGHPNRLYRNNGDGTFTDVAPDLGVDRPIWSFPAWFWDFNNDGAIDIFVGSYEIIDGTGAVARSYLGLPFKGETLRLYQGDGKGGFQEVSRQQKLTQLSLPMGANFGDLDNDGYSDFYLGTGYPNYEALMPNLMYRNQAGQGFADVTTAGGFGHLQKGHGVVFADLDNDGDQDVFEQMGGAFPGDSFGDVLFKNPGFENHWLKVKLIGHKTNKAAIGARIRVTITENEAKRDIFLYVNSGGSFGASPLRKELGLGKATVIDQLEIRWPTSGQVQTFQNVPVNVCLEIQENMQEYRKVSLPIISYPGK